MRPSILAVLAGACLSAACGGARPGAVAARAVAPATATATAPVADASVDVVTVAFGLRNMESWADALREMSRVLRPGGSLFVLDFSLPGNALVRKAHLFYLRKIMPFIAGALTGERWEKRTRKKWRRNA